MISLKRWLLFLFVGLPIHWALMPIYILVYLFWRAFCFAAVNSSRGYPNDLVHQLAKTYLLHLGCPSYDKKNNGTVSSRCNNFGVNWCPDGWDRKMSDTYRTKDLNLDAETVEGLALAREVLKLYRQPDIKSQSKTNTSEQSAFELAKSVNPFLSETSYDVVTYLG